MNVCLLDLSDFPNLLAAGCFLRHLWFPQTEKPHTGARLCRRNHGWALCGNGGLSESVSHFCTQHFALSICIILPACMDNSLLGQGRSLVIYASIPICYMENMHTFLRVKGSTLGQAHLIPSFYSAWGPTRQQYLWEQFLTLLATAIQAPDYSFSSYYSHLLRAKYA